MGVTGQGNRVRQASHLNPQREDTKEKRGDGKKSLEIRPDLKMMSIYEHTNRVASTDKRNLNTN